MMRVPLVARDLSWYPAVELRKVSIERVGREPEGMFVMANAMRNTIHNMLHIPFTDSKKFVTDVCSIHQDFVTFEFYFAVFKHGSAFPVSSLLRP